MAIRFLAFGRTSILFSIVIIPMHIPTNCVGVFQKESNLIHRFSCAGSGEPGSRENSKSRQREQQVKAKVNKTRQSLPFLGQGTGWDVGTLLFRAYGS